MSARGLLLCTLFAVGACDATDDAKTKADEAVEAGKKAKDDAIAAGKKATDDAIEAGKKATDDAIAAGKGKAGEWWSEIPDTGELSDDAESWIKAKAAEASDSIEDVIVEHEQMAPEAAVIGASLASAVDKDTGFEPIYTKVDDTAEVDERIGNMPRVEVIDGLTVGIKRVDTWEGLTTKKERGYLIVWRDGEHLKGFVYRSRSEIDLGKVAEAAPKLIALVTG